MCAVEIVKKKLIFLSNEIIWGANQLGAKNFPLSPPTLEPWTNNRNKLNA